MEYIVKAKISNRHVHLNKETYELLFDEEISKKNDLNQIGEFASNQTLTLRNGNKIIENVRVVGPFRKYNQIEISKKDARILGVNPPVRSSGDLDNTPIIILETNKNKIETNGLIIAERHIHMNYIDAKKYNVVDKQKVNIIVSHDKGGSMDARVKITPQGVFELHIDTDDANAFLIENDDEVMFKI